MMCTVPQMRKEQMRARMISSIHVKLLHLPVKIIIVLKLKNSKEIHFFSFADVSARKNFPWINFGDSLDS